MKINPPTRSRKKAPSKTAAKTAGKAGAVSVVKKTALKKTAAKKTTATKGAKPTLKTSSSRGAQTASAKVAKAKVTDATPAAVARNDSAKKVALAIVEAGLDKKALQAEVIDVRGKVDYADYVVVMSGRSDRQVGAIARGIEGELKSKLGERCLGVEGLPQGNWVLMDFADVVVHIFHEDVRGYYDIESLWLDAARVTFKGAEASAF